jgi:lipoprotein-anchoring transpeptidase ErfK/SrfK
VAANIPLEIEFSHPAVRGLIATISRETNRPARDATVAPSASGLTAVPAATGLKVNATVLAERIERALANPRAARTIEVPTKVTKPAVTEADLASRYPAYIVVDRAAFRLRFYQHLRLTSTYEIAVGRQGLETPVGLYDVQWKQTNPSWYVPNSAWAGALAGKTIPPGPDDPIKARWMAFDGGAGIHGIDPSEYGSIGQTASHGCVRMRIPDVIALYARTPVGTPVFVA